MGFASQGRKHNKGNDMKTLIAGLLMASSMFAADVVTITIKVGDHTVEATVSPDAVTAIQTFMAEQKADDGTPKYASIAELLVKHFRDSLAVPLVQRYSASVKAAVDAKASADAAAVVAAAGTVVVK